MHLIENYFITDKYSDEIKKKVSEYESLIDKSELNENENESLIRWREYFADPNIKLSNELRVKIQEIELKEMTKKKQIKFTEKNLLN